MDAHEYMWFSLKFEYFVSFWLTGFLLQFFYQFLSSSNRFPIMRVYLFNDRHGSNNIGERSYVKTRQEDINTKSIAMIFCLVPHFSI